ncbi:MAG: class I SAM-dependent methyltransferase [Sedimentisphaerales bacterium]|nr:class I SAM-dependent methyltransferase [Sedimentisphaerales bacterium]
MDRTDAPVYCDGGEERRLYENFAGNKNYGNKKNDMKFSSWIEQYHLSPIRQNLLKWFPFDPEGTALEVGAGCGALTGVLSQKLKKVTALEYSEQRAMITAMRHSHCSNLEIVVGGLQDFSVENKFDYITVIGVLEYAGKFYIGENPYESFLTKLRGMLNPKGTLILAIENKIGLKYLCGAKEDHTELIFESIYDYPHTNDVKTFSKRELSDLLHTVGFSSLQWYYPLPDYKLPQQVFSEDTLPCDPDLAWNLFPKGSRGKYMMSEKRLGKTLTKAGLFGEFANSFLIVANIENLPKESMCLQFIGANMHKKRKFRTNKKICWSGGEKTFVVSPDNDESIEFTHKIVEKESLAKSFFGQNAEVVSAELKNDSLIYPYISFPAMHELIAQEIKKGDTEFGKYWIDQYIHFLLKLPSKKCIPEEFMKELGIPESEIREPIHCLNCGIFDCIPHNVMIDTKTGKYYVIDNEFTYDFPIPVDFLIWRAINTLVFDLQGIIQSYVCPKHPVVIFSGHGINRHYIPETWLNILRKLEIPPKQQARWSSAFQSRILRYKVKINLRLKTKSKTLGYVPIAEINTNHRLIEQIYKILGKVRRIL